MFYNSNLGPIKSDNIAYKYGIRNSTPTLTTSSQFTHNGKTYYFQYWAHDKEGAGATSTYPRYTYRVFSNETLYAIYDTKKLQKSDLIF